MPQSNPNTTRNKDQANNPATITSQSATSTHWRGSHRQKTASEILHFPEPPSVDPMTGPPTDAIREQQRRAFESTPHDPDIDYRAPNPMLVVPRLSLPLKLFGALIALLLFAMIAGLLFYNWMVPLPSILVSSARIRDWNTASPELQLSAPRRILIRTRAAAIIRPSADSRTPSMKTSFCLFFLVCSALQSPAYAQSELTRPEFLKPPRRMPF